MKVSPDVSGLTVVSDVLCVTVIQGWEDYKVTYPTTDVCALEGSTVTLRCSYNYPDRDQDRVTTVLQTFWVRGSESEDLRAAPEYSGRVQYSCHEKDCTMTITHLRVSDSAQYKFRFITNNPTGKYTGSPGVTLAVTGNIFTSMLFKY